MESVVIGSALEPSPSEAPVAPFADRRLHQWLDDGVESQGGRYLELHRRLVSYFDRHDRLDANELADETLRRIALTLEQNGGIETKPPARYCYIVARTVMLEDVAREPAPASVGDRRRDVSVRAANVESGEDGVAKRAHCCSQELCAGLQELRADERDLIVEYYGRRRATDHRHRMAERLGISRDDLGTRMHSIRSVLMSRVTSPEGRG